MTMAAQSGSPDGALQHSHGPELAASEYNPSYGPQVVPLCAPEPVHAHYYAGQNAAYAQQNEKTRAQSRQPEASEKKTILGLPLVVFWLLVGGAILFVLGIGLGVGLGIGLSQRNLKSSDNTTGASSSSTASAIPGSPTSISNSITQAPATSTPTTSGITSTIVSSAPVTSGTTGLSDNSCTFTTPRTYYSDSGISLTEYCFTDWPNK